MKQWTPEEKIFQARMFLTRELPFFGSIFLRLNIVEDPTCNTAWVDGKTLGYNQDWLGQWEVIMIVGVLVHEVYHVILKHHLRGKLNPKFHEDFNKWNRACDLSLNPMIHKDKRIGLPPGCLYEDRFKDMLAEHIFEMLDDEEKPDCPKCGGSGMDGDGEPCDDCNGTGKQTQPWEIGEVRPMPGKDGGKATDAELDHAAQEVDQWISSAQVKANNAGRLPADIKRLVKEITTPTVRWEDELQFLCEEITKDDYTWTKPNTRYMQQGIYLPSLYGERSVDMLFFVDTSGSLSNDQLVQIKTEVRKIISTFHIRVIVVYWDTQFQHIEVFEEHEVLEPTWDLDAKGGGGTDFTNVLDWIDNNLEDQEIDPEAVVFFTDLECTQYPDDEPTLPWMWAQVPDYRGRFDHGYLKYKPEWGTHVQVPVFKQSN